MFIVRIAKALDQARIPYAVVGGMSVALHGVARGTLDLDLIIRMRETDWIEIEKVFRELGLISRIPVDAKTVFQFRKEYVLNRNLIAWSFANPNKPHEVVDLLLTEDLSDFETTQFLVAGYKIKTVTLKDLIQMKVRAGRGQDIEDVKMLKDLLKK